MSVEGIIFSNIHDSNISELTRQRTLASVPFGCRYRLIDFPLSNMVNSNINTISVITHYNYHSLMDHIGSGKDWDLARRSGGVKILPPYITAYANNINNLYRSRLEALKSVNYSIAQMTSDYVVMSDCDVICNIDLNDMIGDHIESGADITVAVKYMPLTRAAAKNNTLVFTNEEGRITDLLPYPTNFEGYADVNLNILVINRKYLQEVVLDAIAHGYVSMTRDILLRSLGYRNFRVYKYDGYFACISSFEDYFAHNMQLIENQENLGHYRTLIKLASLAEHDIVFFADQDDKWLPDKTAALQKVLLETDAAMVYGQSYLIDQNGQVIREPKVSGERQERNLAWLLKNWPSGYQTAFRKSVLTDILQQQYTDYPGFDYHDVLFGMLARLYGKVVCLDQLLDQYRIHQANVT